MGKFTLTIIHIENNFTWVYNIQLRVYRMGL